MDALGLCTTYALHLHYAYKRDTISDGDGWKSYFFFILQVAKCCLCHLIRFLPSVSSLGFFVSQSVNLFLCLSVSSLSLSLRSFFLNISLLSLTHSFVSEIPFQRQSCPAGQDHLLLAGTEIHVRLSSEPCQVARTPR